MTDIQQNILKDYIMILQGEKHPMFLQRKYQRVEYTPSDPDETLWSIHDTNIKNPSYAETIPDYSMLDLKGELAHRIRLHCCFCEHRCLVDRSREQGNCGVKTPCISSEFLHGGEEDILVPSHTIFFSGCTLHCVFCQNWDISQAGSGLYVKPERLADIIEKRKKQGSRNVNWVGGDPTPNLSYIIDVLHHLQAPIAQIWNSNMYCSLETMKLLDGIIDVYLTDFKFGNDACAHRLSKVVDYVTIVQRNHHIAYHQGEMIIRHLVMPGHIDCCSKPIIDWISEHTPEVLVNIMGQYHPAYHADEYQEISRPILSDEIQEVKAYAKRNGLFLL